MRYRNSTIWKEAPFVRLILPFCVGIIIEKYLQLPLTTWLPVILVWTGAFLSFARSSLYTRFALRWVYGLMLNGFLLISGGLLAFYHDSTLSTSALARQYKNGDFALIRLSEELSETPATYKTFATVSHLIRGDSVISVNGKLIVYFRKASTTASLPY